MAVLSLSEPQEVKTSSSGFAPSASATLRLHSSSRCFASLPFLCVEDGFPYTSLITRAAASSASGQVRVVAALSR